MCVSCDSSQQFIYNHFYQNIKSFKILIFFFVLLLLAPSINDYNLKVNQ
jgi:hypothetical protein